MRIMESAAKNHSIEGNNNQGLDLTVTYNGSCKGSHDYTRYIYEQLWHACLGLLVTLPTAGERVYYFPQGHIEQLEVPLDDEQRIPGFNIPSKILCRVINVLRRVEPGTDELSVQITLLPELDQTEVTIFDPELPENEEYTIHSFWKTLTTSDLTTLECLCIDSVHAETCFPPLDMSRLEPWQDLVATDISGKEWHFRHIVSGDAMCHLLTAGWSEFAGSKRLQSGDSLIFLREENGKLHVGVKTHKLSSIMPNSSISTGVLATASHALATGSLFTVLYRPRKSQSDFMVKVNKYMEAQHHNFSIGMRFSMRFEADQISKNSSFCTIVDTGDISQIWSNSKWRCLKVAWNGWDGLSVFPPERVSPWVLEPVIAVTDHGTWIFPVEAPNFPYIYRHHINSPSSSSTTSNTNSYTFCEESTSLTSVSGERLASDPESVHSSVGEYSTQYCSDAASGSDNISDGSNNSRSGIPSKCCELEEDLQSNQTRTHTKVRMEGVIVGRSVDMTSFTCHGDLLRKLEMMFEIEGELIGGSIKKWLLVYTDAVGEAKTVEDYPWHIGFDTLQALGHLYSSTAFKGFDIYRFINDQGLNEYK